VSSPPSRGAIALIYRRLPVVILVCAGAVAVALWLSATLTPVYRSQARVFLPSRTTSLSLSSGEDNLPTGPKLPTSSTDTQDSLIGLLTVLQSGEALQQIAAEVDLDAEKLRKNVDFEVDKYNFIVVTAWDQSADRAKTIADSFVSRLNDYLRRKTRESLGEDAAVLEKAVNQARDQVQRIRAEKTAFLAAHGAADFDAEMQALSARIEGLRGSLSQDAVRASSIDDQLASLHQRYDARPEFTETSRVEESNPRLISLHEEIEKDKAALAGELQRHTREWPSVKSLEAKIAAEEEELAAEEATIAKSKTYTADPVRGSMEQQILELELEKTRLATERTTLRSQLEAALAEWKTLPGFRTGLEDIDQRLDEARQDARDLQLKLDETHLALERDPEYLEIVEAPSVASKPSFPDTTLNVVLALVLGLIAGIMVALGMGRAAAWREAEPW